MVNNTVFSTNSILLSCLNSVKPTQILITLLINLIILLLWGLNPPTGIWRDQKWLNALCELSIIADQWSSMPNMIAAKIRHSLVAVRNKLLVIGLGDDTCELYENRSKKFVALKSPPVEYVEDVNLTKAIAIGNKILVFQDNKATVLCYDVDKNEWSEEPCEVTKHLQDFSCVKLPWY